MLVIMILICGFYLVQFMFLCNGGTLAVSILSGKMPVFMHWFIFRVFGLCRCLVFRITEEFYILRYTHYISKCFFSDHIRLISDQFCKFTPISYIDNMYQPLSLWFWNKWYSERLLQPSLARLCFQTTYIKVIKSIRIHALRNLAQNYYIKLSKSRVNGSLFQNLY